MLKNKIGNDMINVGMEVPFQKEIENNHKVAVGKFLHSQECKKRREKRSKTFNKVRVLYYNLMALLIGITVVSVGRLVYEVIQILKMQ